MMRLHTLHAPTRLAQSPALALFTIWRLFVGLLTCCDAQERSLEEKLLRRKFQCN